MNVKCIICGEDASGQCSHCYDKYCDNCFEDHLHDYFWLEPLDEDIESDDDV